VKVHAQVGGPVTDDVGCVSREAREGVGQHLEHRHPGTDLPEGGRQLHPDVARADDDQGLGRRFERQGFLRGYHVLAVEGKIRDRRWPAARCDDGVLE